MPQMKDMRPEYKSVYAQVLQDTLTRIDKAMQNFFRRVKQSKTQVTRASKATTGLIVLSIRKQVLALRMITVYVCLR